MTARNFVPALADMIEELAELDAFIAEDVGARRAAGAQLRQSVLDNKLPVCGLERNDVKWYPGLIADGPRVA